MVAISDTLKETFKSDNFQPKGYVELLHTNEELKSTASFNTSLAIDNNSDVTSIFDGDRQGIQYATLEDGYLKMNGEKCLYNSYMPKTGIISDDIFSNIGSFIFTITNSVEKPVNGLTLYFKDNNPLSLTIVIDGITYTLEGNKPIYNLVFDEEKAITEAIITINSVEYPERRIRLEEVDYGISSVFQEGNLINFNIIEQVSRITEELPANEITIKLNNFEDIFNPINPNGIAKFMDDGMKIKAYIGAKTSVGIEYCDMGIYNLYNWNNTSDYETTIVGRNLMQQINQEEIKDENGELFKTSFSRDNFINYMQNNYNYNLDIKTDWNILMTEYLKEQSLSGFLSDLSIIENAIIYGNRQNTLCIKDVDTAIKETLNLKTHLLQEPLYSINDYYDRVDILRTWVRSQKTEYTGEEKLVPIYEANITLTSESQRVLITSETPLFINFVEVEQTGGTDIAVVSNNLYMMFLNITGNIGDNVTYTLKGYSDGYSETKERVTFGTGKKTMEFDSPILKYEQVVNSTGNYLLDNAYKYKIKTEYTGLPYLEAGDTISIETRFGYKTMFIEKQQITFDGGIEGMLEGVGNV